MELVLTEYNPEVHGHIKHFAGRIKPPFMPKPIDRATTTWFSCAPVKIGVEYRDIVSDEGISLHVFDQAEEVEYLRFDCFEERAHYHYVMEKYGYQDRFFIDMSASGDPVAWSLNALRTRLPAMLRRVDEPELAAGVDPERVDKVMQDVSLAAYEAIRLAIGPSEDHAVAAVGVSGARKGD